MKSLTFSRKKHHSHGSKCAKSRKGFSIVEVAIALGVVTLLLTTFLGIFGPAQKNIQRALSTKDANRMKDALSNEMSILRTTDTSDTSSFNKAFRMIGSSHTKASAVLMYQYRAQPTDTDDDGILPPYTTAGGIQGKDYIIQTAVRVIGLNTDKDSMIEDELKVVDGPVFVVRMTQLVDDPSDSDYVLNAKTDSDDKPEEGIFIQDPDDPTILKKITDPDEYTQAMIAFRAEFFKLGTNKYGFINSFVSNANKDFDDLGNAVIEANMAIRR